MSEVDMAAREVANAADPTDTQSLVTVAYGDAHYIGAAGVDSIAKSGDTPLTGDVTLSAGLNVTLTQTGQDIAIAASGGGGSSTVDVAARSTDLVVTATSAATAQTYIAGNAVTYDGTTQVAIEVFVPFQNAGSSANEMIMNLWEDTTDLGRLGMFDFGGPVAVGTVRTPSAGSHTFTIKVWKAAGSGRQFSAGASSASGPLVNAFYRVTLA